ncbi:MAG: pyrroline-5-carboxylate reductase [Deltaproteobacteria bacterium]|nr:pyrroline-5-carboxylate reductase [Deltaproteobacteria bacterium]
MSDHQTLGFIGAGNMATALIKGLIESGVYDRDHLLAADKDEKALERISADFGITCHPSNLRVTSESAIVVLSVKPQHMQAALKEMKGAIIDQHLLISIAAGIPLRMIRDTIERDIPMVRVMPNTPALVRKGVSALAAGDLATPAHMEAARRIFEAVGETVEVKETLMDAVTALSGSGPGYVFRIMECMVEAGAGLGLEEETALELVVQTFLGAAHLAKTSDDSLSELRRKVTSPGGTTAAGLAVLEEKGLKEMITAAVNAAWARSRELGKKD